MPIKQMLAKRAPAPPGTWATAVRAFRKSRTAIATALVSLAAVIQEQFGLIRDYVPEAYQFMVFLIGLAIIAAARFSSFFGAAKKELIEEAQKEQV